MEPVSARTLNSGQVSDEWAPQWSLPPSAADLHPGSMLEIVPLLNNCNKADAHGLDGTEQSALPCTCTSDSWQQYLNGV